MLPAIKRDVEVKEATKELGSLMEQMEINQQGIDAAVGNIKNIAQMFSEWPINQVLIVALADAMREIGRLNTEKAMEEIPQKEEVKH